MENTLKSEIEKTVIWFVESDISTYGYVREETKEIAKVQKVTIPEKYLKLV